MIITNLKILNFRNHQNFEQTFSNAVNLVIGENSTGKTSILEAIYTLANTKSFRAHNDERLIKIGTDGFYIKGFFKDIVEHTAEISYSYKNKILKFDNYRIKKIREYIAKISIVLYNPLHLYIINEGPVYRREFINIILSKTDVEYYVALHSYLKLLNEKRAALKLFKERKIKFDVIELINKRLSEFASIIVFKRYNFINYFKELVVEKFNLLMNRDIKLIIEYNTNCLNLKGIVKDKSKLEDFKNAAAQKFLKILGAEIRNSRILLGCQADDLTFKDSGNIVKYYYSQGERKALVLALKLAEIKYIREKTGGYPIVLLDDIFSELDDKRRQYLINELNSGFQSIITDIDFNEHLQKFSNFQKIELKKN
ncbi:MAG TPA: DNA replication and repair protein RecF [bacterium]|nr:DNA replication and repair protein RecF [bacterium]